MKTLDKLKSAMGLKVVGHVDVDNINSATRPAKSSREEKEEQRRQNAEKNRQHNVELIVADLQKQLDETGRQMAATQRMIDDLTRAMEADKEKFEALETERLRLEYLQCKAAVREKYLASPISNAERQKELCFNGIRPQKMDVVHFHVPKTAKAEEMDGVALVRDENHYYLAVDMYEHPERLDNTTTMMDENPDGTFDGIWPKHVVLKAASKFEDRYMRTLVDQYAEDLDMAEAFVQTIAENEQKEIDELTARAETTNGQLAERDAIRNKLDEAQRVLTLLGIKQKQLTEGMATYATQENEERRIKKEEVMNESSVASAERRIEEREECEETGESSDDGIRFDLERPEFEPMEGLDMDTDIERKYPHLPYLRGRRPMTTMNWPQIDLNLKPWLRFRQMANIARIMDKVRGGRALTYVLSEEYLEELTTRGRNYRYSSEST